MIAIAVAPASSRVYAGWKPALQSIFLQNQWETFSTVSELYIGWLLHIGQYAKAMGAYTRYAAALTGVSELEALIATLALAGQKEVLQALPPETPLRRQLAAAQAGLSAYSRGEAEPVIREALQPLPIRSPYRDLRQILSALVKLETDPAAAPALVERIAPESPSHGLADIIRACSANEPILALLKLDPGQRELAAQLLGLVGRLVCPLP